MAPESHREATASADLAVGQGFSVGRAARSLAFACAEAEQHYGRFVGRLLLVLAVVLAVDWYLMREWTAQPPIAGNSILITAPLSTSLATTPYVPTDETATMAVDPDALVKGLGVGVALLAATGAAIAFLTQIALHLGALAHRMTVRRAVRRLTRARF